MTTHSEDKKRFEEKILYKTRQHWIIPFLKSLKFTLSIALMTSILTYFLSNYSWVYTILVFIVISTGIVWYIFYLWYHSWLLIWNQKVTLTIRDGFFSQYAMNIRYRNIRDSAVSKSSFFSFLFKYGSLFIRSSGAEGDFEAKFVPKVGKVYALVNALSRYDDDNRSEISSIEELHNHHSKQEFTNVDHTVERHW
jgi:hypothetical protein